MKTPSSRPHSASRFSALLAIMDKLLSPNGCPWDRKQTHSTLVKYLREEAGEVAQAVRKKDWKNLEEELGDVLLQVVFHAALAEKAGRFNINGVLDGINSKLKRRHPHVFGKGKRLHSPRAVLIQWDEIKKEEKKGRLKA